jgi:hypothetical protein
MTQTKAVRRNQAFQPAFNSAGLVKLTFKSFDHVLDNNGKTDLLLVFRCQGRYADSTLDINLRVNQNFEQNSDLFMLFLLLGFKFAEPTIVNDEDGFGIVTDESDDTFNSTVADTFLTSLLDSVFTGKLTRNANGAFRIVPDSLVFLRAKK